jgi:hypothetical protein
MRRWLWLLGGFGKAYAKRCANRGLLHIASVPESLSDRLRQLNLAGNRKSRRFVENVSEEDDFTITAIIK